MLLLNTVIATYVRSHIQYLPSIWRELDVSNFLFEIEVMQYNTLLEIN